MASNLEVESADIIRLILQFFKENNLTRSLRMLQEETNIHLDAVENVDKFILDIQHGKWDVVMPALGTLSLPEELLYKIYEQMVCEMLELREVELARTMLRQTSLLQLLKMNHPERFKRLEQFCNCTYFDAKEVYEGIPKEKHRALISQSVAEHIQSAPPSRLVALIGMALKWQQHQGLLPPGQKFDLFLNASSRGREESELCPQQISNTIKFGSKSTPECAAFSPNGQYLVTGTVDGFVEIWNWTTGKLNKELEYQAKDEFIMHESAVVAIAISRDSELLATGDQEGLLKVWKIEKGVCVRDFDKAHNAAISSIVFSRNSLQLLTSSFDNTCRIFGLKSGKALKEFKGHTSYVNSAIFSVDGTKVISSGSDGKVKIWDAKTAECLQSFSPPQPAHISSTLIPSVNSVFHAPRAGADLIFVCTKSPTIHLTNFGGQVIKTFSSGKRDGGDFVAACASSRGEWIYCVGEDKMLYCFSSSTGKLEHVMKIHEKDCLGIIHHPLQNLLTSWSLDGNVHLLKP